MLIRGSRSLSFSSRISLFQETLRHLEIGCEEEKGRKLKKKSSDASKRLRKRKEHRSAEGKFQLLVIYHSDGGALRFVNRGGTGRKGKERKRL